MKGCEQRRFSPLKVMQKLMNEMIELVKELNIYSYEYYVLDAPSMPDKVYDAKYDRLIELEKLTGAVLPNSPTMRVGDVILDGFEKVTHKHKLWSLDKAQTEDEVKDFITRVEKARKEYKAINPEYDKPLRYVIMKKFDGLTINTTYHESNMELAATRGTGEVGENVTVQAKVIKNQPIQIDYNEDISVHGEAFMTKKAFDEYNKTAEIPLKNLRNGAAGALRNLNISECKKRGLSVIYYDITDTVEHFEYHSEKLSFIKEIGFPTAEYTVCSSYEEVLAEIKKIKDERPDLQFDIDGVVIRVDDIELCEYMGYTIKFPKFAVAFKFEAEETVTTLIDVEWNVGRTGRVNPTGVVEPVELGGVTVKRVTLNNLDDISMKGIKIGSEVYIRRSNDVIPEILGVTKKETKTMEIMPPDTCPACGSHIIRDGAYFFCENTLGCKAQLTKSIAHFGEREAMNIVGFSEKTVESLITKNIISSVKDLYTLADHKDEILAIEKFGEKKYENLIASIDSSRKCDLHRLLYGLNILNVGVKTAKDISKKFKTLDAIKKATVEDFLTVEDVGEVIANDVYNWFRSDTNLCLLDELLTYLDVQEVEDAQITENPFMGKTIVATGTLKNYSRTEIKNKIESLGAKSAGSVSKKTHYVIVGENAGSKHAKALELGIPVLTEDEFESMLVR